MVELCCEEFLFSLCCSFSDCGRTNLNYTGSSTQVLSQGLQSYFKQCNPFGLSGNVPINHRKQDLTRYLARRRVQRYNRHHILHHKHLYYKSFQNSISSKLLEIITNQFKDSSLWQRSLKYDNSTRRQYGHHAKAWHDLTRYDHCWPGAGPTPWTNHQAKHRAKAWEG
jgi:hypothetical protein